MLSIENKSVALYASPDGRQVAILDRNTGEKWMLDPDTVLWGDEISHNNQPAGDWQTRLHRLEPVCADTDGDALSVRYSARGTKVEMIYRLLDDGVEITLPVRSACAGVLIAGRFCAGGRWPAARYADNAGRAVERCG